MEMISGILNSLGVNSTLWIQMGVFLLAYLVLSQFLFKPYLAVFHERHQQTSAQVDHADRIIEETKNLQKDYETQARILNREHRAIYDQSRTEALREFDRLVGEAKDEASEIMAQAQKKITKSLEESEKNLEHEVPDLALKIASQVLGKDLDR